MADRTGIEWTDATWNPVRGCSRVSAGCQHCYAERVASRFSGLGQPYEGLIHPGTKGWNGKVRLVPEVLDQPLRWKRPRRIFVNSMSDLFHDEVPDNFIAAVFAIAAAAPQHTFQILTKRPERARRWFTWMERSARAKLHECLKGAIGYHHPARPAINDGPWPLPNVWLGVSVEDQATADQRIPLLLQCPAAVRWISAEPLLGSVDLSSWLRYQGELDERTGVVPKAAYALRGLQPGLNWVVAGGESGAGARPMHPGWARSLRDQCAAAGVPFLFKQWGEWRPPLDGEDYDTSMGRAQRVPCFIVDRATGNVRCFENDAFEAGEVMRRVGKKAAGRLLDGVLHDGYPEVRHG